VKLNSLACSSRFCSQRPAWLQRYGFFVTEADEHSEVHEALVLAAKKIWKWDCGCTDIRRLTS
jgi:hypothetical protein